MDLECPYCNKGLDVCHDDGFGYNQDEKHQMECGFCNKTFTFETSILFYYEASKADCLNHGKHIYKPTTTFPIEYTKMTCQSCDNTRIPTTEELKIINTKNNS